MSTSKTKD